MKKFFIFVITLVILYGVKYVLFDYAYSTGKRTGNLTKISKKGKFLKTWEGTIDEGSGDKLTSYFSVSNDQLGQQLYEYEGREVVVYYEEHLVAFPYETKYDVVSWTPKDGVGGEPNFDASLLRRVEKTLFCSFIGALRTDSNLYTQVKELIKKNNHYLYQQYQRCNH